MKKLPLLLALAFVIPASIALSACGGSDDSSDAPTKAEFITQADAICARGDDRITAKLKQQFGEKSPNKKETITFISDEVVPNIEQQATELRKLTPPEGDEEEFNALLDSLEGGVAKLKDDPASTLGPDSPLADANKKAQDYGFTSCGG